VVAEVDDGYPGYYAERLWQLLPAIYRSADTDSFETAGPLRELVNRIGCQVAVVRRSIDRLWADQSIETCDDWVIPYLGDLLGTNLVNGLDARGKRLDVAKTIHYRRRKGTIEVLEELARDVTGWDAHVVEGFRRLARTRHGLDPGFGPAAYPGTEAASLTGLLQNEGLLGARSGTPAGGFLDLRDAHGAMLVGTPFDESFHTADVRVGRGALGHFGIPKLLVHLWRLCSFTVTATAVEVAGCNGLAYTFDPTGREVPLFLAAAPEQDDFATAWTSAPEWLVPGPLSRSLVKVMVAQEVAPAYTVEGAPEAAVYPELGRFSTSAAPPTPSTRLTVSYSYGFSSTIGAGPYKRELLGDPPAQVVPVQPGVVHGSGLDTALAAAPKTSTVVIEDSLTYTAVKDVGTSSEPIGSFLCQAGPQQRPVIRVPPGGTSWVFTGGPGAELVLDGLLLSGCDLVLRGAFASVRLTACTLDPGTAAAAGATTPGSAPLASAVDGVPLGPTRIFVEADPSAPAANAGAIEALNIDHCVLGPIRTRNGGAIETLSISDSILQAVPTSSASTYGAADVYDPLLLAKGLLAKDPLSKSLLEKLPAGTNTALEALLTQAPAAQGAALDPTILAGLNALVGQTTPLYEPASYPSVTLSPATAALFAQAAALDAAHLALLNRRLLDEAFPVALGLAALAVADATVELARVSVLGPVALHQLSASDSILTGFTLVEDTQNGCIRFSATPEGSRVARQYLSVKIAAEAAIFTSDAFGSPSYGQLLESADTAIVGGSAGATLSAGAESGSQMGAFSGEQNPIKEQALLIKYAEYLPLGLTPVVVHVT
jgi:hypothetical protein